MISKQMGRCLTVVVLREMQIATTAIFHCLSPLESMNRSLVIPSAGEDTGSLELSYTAAGGGNRTNTLEIGLAVSHKIKHTSTLRPSNSSPRCLPKKK